MSSIKVTVKQDATEEEYPRLVTWSTDDLIVLLVRDSEGTVLQSRTNWIVGHFSKDWVMSTCVPFKGAITLEDK